MARYLLSFFLPAVLWLAMAQPQDDAGIIEFLRPQHGLSKVFYDLSAGAIPEFAGIYYDRQTGEYVLLVVPSHENGLAPYAAAAESAVGSDLAVPAALKKEFVAKVEAAGFFRPNAAYRITAARYSYKQLWDWGSLFMMKTGRARPSVAFRENKLLFAYHSKEPNVELEAEIRRLAHSVGIPDEAIFFWRIPYAPSFLLPENPEGSP